MKSGVIVVGHGSKLDYNKKVVDFTAEKMKSMGLGPVTPAYMQLNGPTIEEGMKWLVSQGVDTIFVQPCFLASGMHLTEDIPMAIGLPIGFKEGQIMVGDKQVTLKYCDPIGEDERVAQILADRVRERM